MNQVWHDLLGKMRSLGERYNQERITPRLLSSTFYAGRAEITTLRPNVDGPLHGPIVGYLALLKSADPLWYEVALAYVDADSRRNGIATRLMRNLLAKKSGANFFAISSDPYFWATAQKCGFVRVARLGFADCKTDHFTVEEWAKSVGLRRERLPRSAQSFSHRKFRKGVRYLFIYKGPA